MSGGDQNHKHSEHTQSTSGVTNYTNSSINNAHKKPLLLYFRAWKSVHFFWPSLIDLLITRWFSAEKWPMLAAAKTPCQCANGATYRCIINSKFFFLHYITECECKGVLWTWTWGRCSDHGAISLWTLWGKRAEWWSPTSSGTRTGLLTRQTMLRTPFVWIQVRPPPLLHSRSRIASIRGRLQRLNRTAELFRPHFSAECHRWLNEPLAAPYQRLAR